MKKYDLISSELPNEDTGAQQVTTRRSVLKNAALLGAGAAFLATPVRAQDAKNGAGKAKPNARPNAPADSDLTILNFAFLLERLEQSFYAQAVNADAARPYLHGRLRDVVPMLRDNEAQHVATLSAAITGLGDTPNTNARFVFPDPVFISPITFARFAYTIEEIGIGAYLGALGSIEDDGLRAAAASIYGNETRHAALIRHLGGYAFSPRYYESPLTVAQVQSLIGPYVVA